METMTKTNHKEKEALRQLQSALKRTIRNRSTPPVNWALATVTFKRRVSRIVMAFSMLVQSNLGKNADTLSNVWRYEITQHSGGVGVSSRFSSAKAAHSFAKGVAFGSLRNSLNGI